MNEKVRYGRNWLALFIEKGNPLYAWHAYKTARNCGEPIPEEVLRYFDHVADGILKIANDPPQKDRPAAIAKLMKLSGTGRGRKSNGPFEHFSKEQKKREIAMKVYRDIGNPSDRDATGVYNDIAKTYGFSVSMVREWYIEFLHEVALKINMLIDSGAVVYDTTTMAHPVTTFTSNFNRLTSYRTVTGKGGQHIIGWGLDFYDNQEISIVLQILQNISQRIN